MVEEFYFQKLLVSKKGICLNKQSLNCVTRAAMTSIQQLRGDLTSSGDQPSTNLATYFKVGF